MKLQTLYSNLLKLDVTKVAAESVDETKEVIADLNVEQMQSGKRSDGSETLPKYTPFTIRMKQLKGQPFDRVTLYDTGDFQNAISVQMQGLKVIIDSSDPKTQNLEDKYNSGKGEIFGLNDEFKKEYITNNLRPVFNLKIESLTGLKFK
jgi:hypothetical protein